VEPQTRRIKNIHISGFWFGYAQCARLVFIGIVFSVGAWIIKTYDECIASVFIGIVIMFTALAGASMSFSNVPSVSIAKASANTIFSIIDEKSTLDIREGHQAKI